MRIRILLSLLLLLGPGGAEAANGATEPDDAYRYARVTYLTSRSVYVDAGSEMGLQAGQTVEILRGGDLLATLTVTEVSARRAVCARVEGGVQLQAGDQVRFVPLAGPGPEPEPVAAAPVSRRGEERESNALRAAGLRGRIGLRYLALTDRLENGSDFSQPAIDLRVDGTQVGGAPVDFNVDVRARRTYRDLIDGDTETDDINRIYRLSGSWRRAGSPWNVTVGRQFSPSISVVSIFDGVHAEYRKRRWAVGGFSGTQPEEADMGYSSDTREHGGFFEWRTDPQAERRWTFTTGLIGSYEESEINREFTFLQSSYRGPRLSLWLTEEVDLNRGWREDAEDESISFTSTFVSLNYRAWENWDLRAGYDNRRNVRLYRDLITPETEFDDEYRNGVWGGVSWRFAKRMRVGVDLRTNGGGSGGDSDAYTLTFGASGLTRAGLFVNTRSTSYTNDLVEGWLHSAGIGLSLGRRWTVELNGGLRDEENRVDPLLDDQLTWYGLQVDLLLGRSWLFSVSAERSESDIEATDQIYSSLTWRF